MPLVPCEQLINVPQKLHEACFALGVSFVKLAHTSERTFVGCGGKGAMPVSEATGVATNESCTFSLSSRVDSN